MPQLLSLSPSKITAWQDCPRRFFLQYVQRQRSEGVWAHLSLGLAIHAVLRDWYQEPRAAHGTADTAKSVMSALVARHWSDAGFADAEHSLHWRDWAVDVTWQYVTAQESSREPVSCERTLAARTDHVAIQGRIDRIDSRRFDCRNFDGDGSGHVDADGDREEYSDALVVIDYKTGAGIPTADQARSSLALALYAACVQQSLRRPCTRVELHHIPSGVIAGWDHSAEAIDRQLRRVDQIAQDMREQERQLAAGVLVEEIYPPRVSGLCGYCGFRAYCPEGSAAVPAREPWAGLPSIAEDAPAGDVFEA